MILGFGLKFGPSMMPVCAVGLSRRFAFWRSVMRFMGFLIKRLVAAAPITPLWALTALAQQSSEATAPAAAAAPVAPAINSGDTAWMLTSVALVLMMTVPGLPCSMAAWSAR
jgi:hypothetical protein